MVSSVAKITDRHTQLPAIVKLVLLATFMVTRCNGEIKSAAGPYRLKLGKIAGFKQMCLSGLLMQRKYFLKCIID